MQDTGAKSLSEFKKGTIIPKLPNQTKTAAAALLLMEQDGNDWILRDEQPETNEFLLDNYPADYINA